MNIFELARSGEIHLLMFGVIVHLVFIAPIAFLVAWKKNRLSVSMAILCLLPFVNLYTLFFLMFFRALPKASKEGQS